VLFSAIAVQCAPGYWTLYGLCSWIMDWSGYLFNVYKRYHFARTRDKTKVNDLTSASEMVLKFIELRLGLCWLKQLISPKLNSLPVLYSSLPRVLCRPYSTLSCGSWTWDGGKEQPRTRCNHAKRSEKLAMGKGLLLSSQAFRAPEPCIEKFCRCMLFFRSYWHNNEPYSYIRPPHTMFLRHPTSFVRNAVTEIRHNSV